MSKKGEYIKFKKYEGKTWSLFAIFVDFEIILVPEMESKTQKILIRTNFKNMLCAVVAIN